MRIALAAFLAAGVLTAQEAPARVSVAGVAINSSNGEPVRKATVILRAEDEAAGTSYVTDSDGNGRFSIEDVAPGAYAVSADRQGFMLEANGAPGAPPPSLKVEAGQSVIDVRIKLVPLGAIAGRVLDDDGDPVRGAQVEAMAYTYQAGKRRLSAVEQVSANDKGEFRLFGLRSDTFFLRAAGRNRRRFAPSDSIPGSSTPTFFPSTTDAAHASPIELAVGAQLRGLDIRLRSEKHYSVRGKLPELKQGVQRMLQIAPRGGGDGSLYYSQGQDNETFVFMDLRPGSYVVTGTIVDGDKQTVARQAVEVVNADVEGLTLNFVSPIEVSGSVRVEGTLRRPLDNLHVSLQGDSAVRMAQSSAEVKSDGSFVIPVVLPDVYEIAIGPLPGAYVKSIRFGDEEAPDGRIDLTKGSASVAVLLATDVGEVEGSVKKANGDPAARVRVTLIAYGSHLGRTDLANFGFADEQGKFHLRSVAPGEYKVFAWEDVPAGAPQDPEFRKPFEKQAVAVKMAPNGHETVELTAISVKRSQRPN